jgi:hypothetical protein
MNEMIRYVTMLSVNVDLFIIFLVVLSAEYFDIIPYFFLKNSTRPSLVLILQLRNAMSC